MHIQILHSLDQHIHYNSTQMSQQDEQTHLYHAYVRCDAAFAQIYLEI